MLHSRFYQKTKYYWHNLKQTGYAIPKKDDLHQ